MNEVASQPRVSFIISTFNRREVLLETLARVKQCSLRREQFEILLVDNASSDGTAAAISGQHPDVKLISLPRNRGSCAKNIAILQARGEFIVFLDDDSFPQPGSVERMLTHFLVDPKLGAAVFTVTLLDGTRECSAYPEVFIGCGTGLRRRAIEQVGGLPDDFFMQAEEYDLSLRLLDAGWRVRTFEDLHVTHLKSPQARRGKRTTQLDVRNNLVLATRHFPRQWAIPFALDWMRRYYVIASAKGHRTAYLKGLLQGIARSIGAARRHPVAGETFETFAKVEQIEQLMRRAQNQHQLRTIVFVDLGKNMLPYWRAAKRCGITVVGIADAGLARTGKRYRGLRIIEDRAAAEMNFDAAIVSNLSPVHAARRTAAWRCLTDRPVIDLFEKTEIVTTLPLAV